MSIEPEQAKPLSALVAAHAEEGPQAVLELVLAEAEKRLAAARTKPEVRFGPKGLEAANLDGLWRIGHLYAQSSMIPDHYRGKDADCAIGAELAMRLGISPMMFFQNTFVVHGKPGMSASLQIALANDRKVFRGPIRYELTGDGMARQCTAYALDRETGARCEQIVTMAMAKAEGWLSKNGSKWLTIPDLMLRYRAAAWLIRTHCPEVVMGMLSHEELEDIDGPQAATKPSGALTELVSSLPDDGNGEEQEQPTDKEEAIPVDDECSQRQPDEDPVQAEQQQAEQAGLVAEYEGLIQDSRSEGELSAWEAKVKSNKVLTETSLLRVLEAVARRRQAIGAKPAALPARRGRPAKPMFADPNVG
jgi:hypothetical protein